MNRKDEREHLDTHSGLTVGRLARKVGLSAEAVRYYERLGLLAPAVRSASNYRYYGAEAERRLRFIRRAQALGFSLSEIAELLSLHTRPEADMGEVKRLARARIAQIEVRITDLEHMKVGLMAVTERCPGHGSSADCPILGALLDDAH